MIQKVYLPYVYLHNYPCVYIYTSIHLFIDPSYLSYLYTGQQVFDHMRPTPVVAANSYRSGGGDDSYGNNNNSSNNSSKYRSAADDMKNYINGSNDSYKSMKGNVEDFDDDSDEDYEDSYENEDYDDGDYFDHGCDDVHNDNNCVYDDNWC